VQEKVKCSFGINSTFRRVRHSSWSLTGGLNAPPTKMMLNPILLLTSESCESKLSWSVSSSYYTNFGGVYLPSQRSGDRK
jgi:hypothetical protein